MNTAQEEGESLFGEPAPKKADVIPMSKRVDVPAKEPAPAATNPIAAEKEKLSDMLAMHILNKVITLADATRIIHHECVKRAKEEIKGLSQKGREDLRKKLTNS